MVANRLSRRRTLCFWASANFVENIVSDAQMPVRQGFAASGKAPEQSRGPSILVAGANELVGRTVVCQLVAQPWAGSVIALVRRRGTLAPGQAVQGQLHGCVVDFDRLDATETQPAFAADIVICAFGTTIRQAGSQAAFWRVDVEYPVDLARRAFAADAHYLLLVSALGADAHSRVFYNRYKGEMETEILAIGFPSVMVARPSLLLGAYAEFHLGEHIAQALSPAVGWMMPRTWRPMPAESVAAALVTVTRVDTPGVRMLENAALLGVKNERPAG